MKKKFVFNKKNGSKNLKNSPIEKTFRNWAGKEEKWLIVVPHDDDAAIGMALTILAGLENGIDIHVRITTDGQMGYCYSKHRKTISKVRKKETLDSFKILGLPSKNIKWLDFKDCSLNLQTGRYTQSSKSASKAQGFDGLQNAYTQVLREVRPTRLFVATSTDLHPDHKLVHSELMISLFHASGDIWPELGKPTIVPEVVEFAVYCDFPSAPNIQLSSDLKNFNKKLDSVAAYQSQIQIKTLVENLKNNGPVEYLREVDFSFYNPKKYQKLFR